MSQHKEQVRRFYACLWDAFDRSEIDSILSTEVSFRGSLGDIRSGHDGFWAYVEAVHAGLSDYRCRIDTLIEEGPRVAAKMQFGGRHTGEFFAYAPSGQNVSWSGCAIFTFDEALIVDVWVLGDLKALEAQLAEHARAN